MTEQTDAAEVARDAATLYDEVRGDVMAEPVGSLVRRLHSALGDLAHAVLTAPDPAAAEVRGAQAERMRRMDYAAVKGYELGYVEGAQAVLAAVEAYVAEVEANAAEHQHLPRLDRDVLRARAAAAAAGGGGEA